jgi:hypothetical protein
MGSFGPRDIEVETHLGRTPESDFYYFAKQERGFVANPELTNPSSGDTSAMLLRNPSGSGKTAVFAGVSSTPTTRSYARIYDTFDSTPTAGTEAVIDNVLLGSADGSPPDTGAVEVSTDPTFSVTTPDDIHMSDTVGGGTGNSSVGGSVELPILMLEPGRDAVLEVEKLTSGPDEVPMRARWFEVPVVYSDANTDPQIAETIRAGYTGE